MTRNSQFDPKKLYMIPLGGSGEIGMNLNVYVFGGKLLVVDTGVTFENLPGVEVVMPDIGWLAKQKKHIVGIAITHAHEDHVGAIGHLWPELGAPIYATPFTTGLMTHKLQEARVRAPVNKVPLNGSVKIGPFDVTFVGLTHSVPEPSALAIKTGAGTVVHTGDWKIDPTPLVGAKTDEKALKALGKEGVLALVCDSTCVFEEGWSGSEKTVQTFLTKHLKSYKTGRVVVACFASNVARMFTCFKAAEACGRKVVLAGRSLDRMNDIARKTGYFEDLPPFLKDNEAKNLPPEKTLIVATGSQGEPRAALRRMAFEQHPKLHLDEGDAVIFSSRTIPGNEKEIYALQNQLVSRGIKVVTPKQYPDLHVSGHPSRDELKQMYTWLRPFSAVPVHGEDRHLIEHASFAKDLGAKSLAPHNGDVIVLDAKKGPLKVGKVPSGRRGLDGHRLVPLEGQMLSDRRFLAMGGFVMISLSMQKKQLQSLQVSTMGVEEVATQEDLERDIQTLVKRTFGRLSDQARSETQSISDALAKDVRGLCQKRIGKKPFVAVHVLS